jgi:hypothetical protein
MRPLKKEICPDQKLLSKEYQKKANQKKEDLPPYQGFHSSIAITNSNTNLLNI